MKRVRIQGWSGQLLSSRARPCCPQQQHIWSSMTGSSRSQSTDVGQNVIVEDGGEVMLSSKSKTEIKPAKQYLSPDHKTVSSSAKLAALHARLALPSKLPLETLARTLVDPTADASKEFNNAAFANIGQALLSYHVTEWLVTTYPRLPMSVLYAAISAYIGPATLYKIATEWGVESAAYPGPEVDPGLLQFEKWQAGKQKGQLTYKAPSTRRGISSKVVNDDEFRDLVEKKQALLREKTADAAHEGFVRALLGAIYIHAGTQAAKNFVNAHILSRHLPMDRLFEIRHPTRDLSRLCAREGFEPATARLVSETGRLSRHPVFVVGVFSGNEKLGEGSGPSLDEARQRAAISALKAWYLYSPTAGRTGRVPSDVDSGGDWKPVHIDIGEIV